MDDSLKTRLTELGLNDEQVGKLETEGAVNDMDMARLSAEEIKGITGCGLLVAKRIAEAFTPVAPTAPAAADTITQAAQLQSILPALPDDTSFLELLKVGGVLKIDRTNVMAALRAAIAERVGLFNLPDILMARMEQFAVEQEEPLGEPFYRLQRQLAERRYGDILSALGTTGQFVNDRRKRETLNRLNEMLWPALRDFNNQLKS